MFPLKDPPEPSGTETYRTRQKEGELAKRLEQGMDSKSNWSLKEKLVQVLVWSSWIRKLKRKGKKENLEEEVA